MRPVAKDWSIVLCTKDGSGRLGTLDQEWLVLLIDQAKNESILVKLEVAFGLNLGPITLGETTEDGARRCFNDCQ